MEKTTNKEDLLKAVADVLDEALAEYEKLAKMEGLEEVEDPSRQSMKKMDEKQAEDSQSPDMAQDSEDSSESEGEEDGEDKEEGEEGEDKEEEMDDDTLKAEYSKMCAKMESRGFLKKSQDKVEDIKKSEAPAQDKTEELRKSVDERFEALTKTVAQIAETVSKIASAPARKGVAGYQPLRKSEESEAQPLNKAEVISKLLDLKKSGKYVDTALINRIETGRSSEADAQAVKQLLG